MAAGNSPGWIDLQAMLTEELECIRQGGVAPESREKSETESAQRDGAAPSGEFFKQQFAAGLWGLGLSGGGIRSATFALGLIQGMAAAKLLPRFHYLSTVSGGGYVGSWLSSWAHRHERGIDGVVDELNDWAEGNRIEAVPLRYLRSFTSYLTPQLGLLSADTWTLIATYLRNLLLNTLVLVPLLWALVLTPKIGLALVRLQPSDGITGFLVEQRRFAAVAAWAVGSLCLTYGMAYIFSALVEKLSGEHVADAERNPAAKVSTQGQSTQGQFLLHCLLPVMLASLLLPLAWAWYPDYAETAAPSTWLLLAVITGVALRFIAWGASYVVARLHGRLEHKTSGRPLYIAAACLVTGALGGFLVWWILTTLFGGIAATAGRDDAGGNQLDIASYVCFAPPLLLAAMLATEAVFIGLVSRSDLIDDEDREWWGRAGGWLLIASLFWMALRVLALYGPLSLHLLEAQAPVIVTALGGVSGLVTAALGFSVGTPGTSDAKGPKTVGGILRGSALTLAAAIFVYTVFAGLALAGDWILHLIASPNADIALSCTDTDLTKWRANCAAKAAELQQSVGLVAVLAAIAALVLLAGIMQVFVSINRFSLHAMYRARLIRAYLGASNPDRNPNWFTGFDKADNVVMADIKAGGSKRFSVGGKPPRYPLHIVNTALNLVHGENLAWQQRKAASMTISPLHVGNRDLGYRRSRTYGHPNGISLGTALTISGAAASPNMGYHSSPIIGLVMTLFNVRLGAWLGNPGRVAGDHTFSSEGPRFSAWWLMSEAFGLTDSKRGYVYLTDGGHFENLGLYELVQRRCGLIVISDAGCDPAFEFADLGNAIRKIRVDLGIEITMDEIAMHSRSTVDDDGAETIKPGRYFATGTIHYPEWKDDKAHDGTLIYIKPGIYGDEPRDVMNYAATHPDFPHESTADQWFDESQFESYRRLGKHAFESLIKNTDIHGIFMAGGRPPSPPGQKPAARPPVSRIHRRRPRRWLG